MSCANEDGSANLVGVVAPSVQPTVNRAYKIATQTQVVDVEPGSEYKAWAESGHKVVVNFYDDQNSLTHADNSDIVPKDAARGSVCVVLEKTDVRKWIPNPTTTFHYQDGFPVAS